MTVSRHRRRMTTTRAVVASIAGIGLAAGLGAAGGVAIYNTKDGQVLSGDESTVTFPSTPTGMVAVLDETGGLASLAAFAIRPAGGDGEDGRGGTVVPVPVSADSSGGFGDERLPLNETVSLFGVESLTDEVPNLLGITIDSSLVLDGAQLAELLAPIGAVDVELPIAVVDAAGQEVAPAGAQTVTGDQLAAVLASRDSGLTGADRYQIDLAVWQAIAGAVGEGLVTPLAGPGPDGSVAPAALASGDDRQLVGQLTAGPMSVQPLRSTPLASVDVNPRGVDAVALDRAELAVIFGHIAPSKVAAPGDGFNFRIVSRFSDDQLPDGIARLDVAYTAAKALLDIGSNVLSVDTAVGEAGTATVVEVTDEGQVAGAEVLEEQFGPLDVQVVDSRLAGIDVIVTLGTDYLARLDTGVVTSVPGTAGGASEPAATSVPATGEPVEGTG
jgi:hypothetical protein